ncbi:MAG: hypothetical protein AAGE01_23570, partial [Pseudomonadota bacterium]
MPERHRCFVGLAALFLLLSSGANAAPENFREIVRDAGPSVVNIEARRSLDPDSLAQQDGHSDIPDFLERFFSGPGD